jgi:polygalacturonase
MRRPEPSSSTASSLKSRVTLYLKAGCVLLGSRSFGDYDNHPGPPMQGGANVHHVIFAQNAEDVTLCGPGTIDGQGEAY